LVSDWSSDVCSSDLIYVGIIVLIARFEPGGLVELWQRLAASRLQRRGARRHAA